MNAAKWITQVLAFWSYYDITHNFLTFSSSLMARYGLICAESAVKPQPTNL